MSRDPRHRADPPARSLQRLRHQIAQAILVLWRLSRLADLGQRIYEFCQDHWPQDWFAQVGEVLSRLPPD